MSLLDRIRECDNAAELEGILPFSAGGVRVGWMEGEFAAALAAYPGVFAFGPEGISLAPGLTGYAERTGAVADVLRALEPDGWFTGWRDEAYPVGTGFYDPPLFEMERAAVPRFGIRAYGVHVNGFVRRDDGLYLWIGRRADDKPTFPGMLDNMVAGGQPVGIGLKENVIKEAAEEASVPAAIAEQAISVGAISYRHLFDDGIKPDVMFVFDMEVPEDFVPVSADGEMAAFECLPAEEVMRICAETRDFKFNCAVVNIDFFIRHGVLTPDHPDYLEILRGMHR